jgi:parallel beta-helix repeat protein
MLTLALNVQPVKATLNITSDFTFTENIYEPLVVMADNIVIDGNGYTLQGAGSGTGIYLPERNNVTITNAVITQWENGIYLLGSSNNTIFGNTITDESIRGVTLSGSSNNTISENIIANCDNIGVRFYGSSNNTISGNTITWSSYGVYLVGSSDNNTVSGNTITNNWHIGVHLHGSSNNSIIENTITDNSFDGVYLYSSSDNKIYHNNFIDNLYQGREDQTSFGNIWDNGYPSGGNYWSDYSTKYPDAQELDDSGIWDTPYIIIGAPNQDNYPLMEPWTPLETIEKLIEIIANMNLPKRTENSLTSKLCDALKLLDKGNITGAVHKLGDFIDQVEALRENKLTNEQADILILKAQIIISQIQQ